jgi:CubicO group peptidase (beta-lactamase class C family)
VVRYSVYKRVHSRWQVPVRDATIGPDTTLDPALKPASKPTSPRPADQATRFRKCFEIIERAITDRAFPGAALAVTLNHELLVLAGFGQFTYDAASPKIAADTIFDVASLSKPVATTTMAMLLYERGFLEIDSPVAAILPELNTNPDPRSSQITFRMLLSHSSGLPAHVRLYEKAAGDEVFVSACKLPLEAAPGSRAEYSDIGFILLGRALERLADEDLFSFCRREVFGPLGMTRTMFTPPPALRPSIPPTRDATKPGGKPAQGEVNDENASALGGIAGHAGVFSTAGDLGMFANCLLRDGNPILRPETVALFMSRQNLPAGSSWALGWDTPTQPSQSGNYLSPRAYGHLGFTGTSLWIDPERRLSVTLLTNRTWPDSRSQEIKKVRPSVHNAIVEALGLT